MPIPRYAPQFAVVAAAILWSFDGLLRQHLSGVPSISIVFVEHLLGAIVFSPFLIRGWSEIRAADRRAWASIGWIALFGGLVGTFCYTKALSYVGFIDLSVVVLLQKLQPVFAIALAATLLKEAITARFLAFAVVAMLGGYLLSFPNGIPDFSADGNQIAAAGLAVAAALAWGSSTVMGKYALRSMSFFSVASLRLVATAVLALPLLFLVEAPRVAPVGGEWVYVVAIVLSTGGVAVFIYYFGLQRIPASHATLLELFWPLSAVVIDWAVYGRILSPVQILGAVMLVAVSIALAKGRRKE